MSSFHNLTADLPHPAHHDGSQLLPYDDFDYMPGSNFDEDDIISVNPPDVNVVDAPVVRLKPGRPSSDIWTWFTSDTNSHHLNNCNMSRRLINEMKGCDRPDWYVRNKKKCKTVSSSSNAPSSSYQASIKQYAFPKLSRIEDLHLKNAIKSLRPNDNLLPNKSQSPSTLLYECHQEVVAKVDTRMKGSTCCLTTDGWSNINDDPVDIIAATKTKQAGNTETTYPIDYSFQEMLEFIVDFRDVTKMFHNHRVVKAWLQELKKTTNSRVLVRPAPTRWETIQQMCQRLLDSESHLDTISSARNFIKGTAAQQAERQKVKDIITDD
ncbi:hypothetical protein BASA60_006241 [Batrachochytrium salamandrivorans]|nr:hypothetical protein BASA60_006241 [Batrachochytrium salamandrivorans]